MNNCFSCKHCVRIYYEDFEYDLKCDLQNSKVIISIDDSLYHDEDEDCECNINNYEYSNKIRMK